MITLLGKNDSEFKEDNVNCRPNEKPANII